nr:MAG TPA: hypothetical protein [Caudoviricetes sp.]
MYLPIIFHRQKKMVSIQYRLTGNIFSHLLHKLTYH